MPENVKKDMLVLAKIADTARIGLPIPSRPSAGPLSTAIFYTDAAGASYTMVGGERVYHDNEGKGVACLGGDLL